MKINKRLAAALTCYTLLIAAALWQLLPARTRYEQFILGAVLFFFQESHDIRIVTGYGLEGALNDVTAKRQK